MNTIFELKEKEGVCTKRLYDVFMFNDDITPVEYVVIILTSVFDYEPEEAVHIALLIDASGDAGKENGTIIGTYEEEEAYDKIETVSRFNELCEQSLRVSLEME